MSNAQTDKQIWLDEALDLCPEGRIRDEASEYLQPLLKRSNSKSRKTFWQWLRLTLAKSQDTAVFLSWVQESRIPTPVEKVNGFQYSLSADGGTALILVTDGEDHAVWHVPVSHLQWALDLYPVKLKRLPALESQNAEQIRKLKRKIKREMPFLTPAQREGLERGIAELEAAESREYTPVPRFMLVKYQDGQELEVHRVFMNAGPNDEIATVDGDFLNFTTVTVRSTIEARNCPVEPFPPFVTEIAVQNLQVTNNVEAQKAFESSLLQVKTTLQGDIKTSLPIQPNSKWRAGVEGGLVQDCGSSYPMNSEEKIVAGLQGGEVRPKFDVDAIQRRWRVPAPPRGSRWGE